MISINICLQNNPLYDDPPVGSIQSAVWDLTSESTLPPGVEPGTVDIILCVFVLSALHPNEWGKAIANIHRVRRVQFRHRMNSSPCLADAKARRDHPSPRLWTVRSHPAAVQIWENARRQLLHTRRQDARILFRAR